MIHDIQDSETPCPSCGEKLGTRTDFADQSLFAAFCVREPACELTEQVEDATGPSRAEAVANLLKKWETYAHG